MRAALSIPPPLRERSLRDKSLPFSPSHDATTAATMGSTQDLTSTVSRSYSPMTSQPASQRVALSTDVVMMDNVEEDKRSGSGSYLAATDTTTTARQTHANNIEHTYDHRSTRGVTGLQEQSAQCSPSQLYRVTSVAAHATRARSASPPKRHYSFTARHAYTNRPTRAHSATNRSEASTTTSPPPVKVIPSVDSAYRTGYLPTQQRQQQEDVVTRETRKPYAPMPHTTLVTSPLRSSATLRSEQVPYSVHNRSEERHEGSPIDLNNDNLDKIQTSIVTSSNSSSSDVDEALTEVQAIRLQRRRIRSLVHEKAQLTAALEELRDLFEHLTQDYDDVTRAASMQNGQIESLQAQIATLREELRTQQATCTTQEAQIARFSETWCERSAGLQGQLALLSQERTQLLQQRDELLSAQHTLRKEVEALQEALRREKEQHELHSRRERQTMEEALQNVYAEKERLLAVREGELRRSAATLEETMHHVASENDRNRELLQGMKRTVANLELQLQHKSEAHAQAERTISSLRAELAQTLTESRAQRECAERRSREVQHSYEAELQELRRLQRESTTQNSVLQQKVQEMAAAQQTALAQAHCKSEATLQAQQRREDELRAELQRVNDELSRTRTRAETAERRVCELSEVRAQLEQRVALVQSSHRELEAAMMEKVRVNHELRLKVDHLLRRLAAQDEALEHYRRVMQRTMRNGVEAEPGMRYVTWHTDVEDAIRPGAQETTVHTPLQKANTIDSSPSAHIASAQKAADAHTNATPHTTAPPNTQSQPDIETIDRSPEREASTRNATRQARLSGCTSRSRYSLTHSLSQARQKSIGRGSVTFSAPLGQQRARHQYNIVTQVDAVGRCGMRDVQNAHNITPEGGHPYSTKAQPSASFSSSSSTHSAHATAHNATNETSVYFDELPGDALPKTSHTARLNTLRTAAAVNAAAYSTRPNVKRHAYTTTAATPRAKASDMSTSLTEQRGAQRQVTSPSKQPSVHETHKDTQAGKSGTPHEKQTRTASLASSSLQAATASSSTYEIHRADVAMPRIPSHHNKEEKDILQPDTHDNLYSSQTVETVVQEVLRKMSYDYALGWARSADPQVSYSTQDTAVQQQQNMEIAQDKPPEQYVYATHKQSVPTKSVANNTTSSKRSYGDAMIKEDIPMRTAYSPLSNDVIEKEEEQQGRDKAAYIRKEDVTMTVPNDTAQRESNAYADQSVLHAIDTSRPEDGTAESHSQQPISDDIDKLRTDNTQQAYQSHRDSIPDEWEEHEQRDEYASNLTAPMQPIPQVDTASATLAIAEALRARFATPFSP